MSEFTLQDLAAIAREVIGGRHLELRSEMSAKDVPGWDSLNHTLIVIEIGERRGLQLSARELAEMKNFGELLEFVNARAKG